MRPATHLRKVESSGVTATGKFHLDLTSQVHLMTMLRDTVYKNKVLAVLREYSTNAWDAHREVGKGDLPIEVTLPTNMDPNLKIRDYGPGLSERDAFAVYTAYGASTKRESNDVAGMLGIGSKSGFAYGDSFTVTSWHGGKKVIYAAVLDETDAGTFSKLHEEDCGDETGVEILIPVRAKDVLQFHTEAKKLFRLWLPAPKINISLPPFTGKILPSGHIQVDFRHHSSWFALMGPVAYPVDMEQIQPELEDAGLYKPMSWTQGFLKFDMGQVQIVASREELRYTDFTKKALVAKLKSLVDEHFNAALRTLRDPFATPWSKRLQGVLLQERLKMPLPPRLMGWAAPEVPLPSSGRGFSVRFRQKGQSKVKVSDETTILIYDDKRAFSGYQLNSKDVVIIPSEKTTDVKPALKEALASAGLTGVPVESLSKSRTWYKPTGSSSGGYGYYNPKHKVNCFVLKPKTLSTRHKAKSDHWEVVSRIPEDDDVYVTIWAFEMEGKGLSFKSFSKDMWLAKALGVEMPPLYGYKNTMSNPFDVSKVKGIHYLDWRKKAFKAAATRKHRMRIRDQHWVDLFEDGYSRRSLARKCKAVLKEMVEVLGKKHPLCQILSRYLGAKARLAKTKGLLASDLKRLGVVLGVEDKAEDTLKKAIAQYPLLRRRGINVLSEDPSRPDWLEYIQLKDAQAAQQEKKA